MVMHIEKARWLFKLPQSGKTFPACARCTKRLQLDTTYEKLPDGDWRGVTDCKSCKEKANVGYGLSLAEDFCRRPKVFRRSRK